MKEREEKRKKIGRNREKKRKDKKRQKRGRGSAIYLRYRMNGRDMFATEDAILPSLHTHTNSSEFLPRSSHC